MTQFGYRGIRSMQAVGKKSGILIGIFFTFLFCSGILHAQPAASEMPPITVRELKSDRLFIDNDPLLRFAQSAASGEEKDSKPAGVNPTQPSNESPDEYGDVTPQDLGISGKKETSDEYGDVTATEPVSGEIEVHDPIKPFNVAMYHFNDKVYYWAWKPVSQGYKAVVPEDFRTLFSNFYENLKAPVRIFNNLFQGDAKGAGTEFISLLINSTIGVGGLRNCAQECFGIQRDYADFGQTLGKWGFGYGFYLVLPFLGPSSAREGVGSIVDWPMKPTSWIGSGFVSPESVGLFVHEKVNYTSFHIGEYEALQRAAVDPYIAMRDIFLQYRNNLIKQK